MSIPIQAASELKTFTDKDKMKEAIELLDLIGSGATVAEAARQLHISRGTAFARLKLVQVDADQGVVMLMRAAGARVFDDWLLASQVAAGRGDHRPARDMLLYSNQIEELQGDKRNAAQVLIQIGSPERPLLERPPVIEVVEAQQVSPPEPDSSS